MFFPNSNLFAVGSSAQNSADALRRSGAASRQGSGGASGGLLRLCKVPQCLHLGWVPEGSGVRVWRSGWVLVGYDVATRLGIQVGLRKFLASRWGSRGFGCGIPVMQFRCGLQVGFQSAPVWQYGWFLQGVASSLDSGGFWSTFT